MAKLPKAKLDGADIATVVALIEAWEGPLTWARLVSRVASLLGRPFSRQALDAHSKVKLAYQSRKVRLRKVLAGARAGKSDTQDMPPELVMAMQRADAIQARVDRLQVTVDAYEVKFVTWLYNARIAGISEEMLNSPLPPIDRNSDTEPGAKVVRR